MYNVERYLGEAIDSIRSQTFEDFEVVLVDDGSTDSTAQIAEAACEGDTRFRLVQQSNSGPGGARNAGLDSTDTELVMFLDSDDLLRPTMLGDMVRAIDLDRRLDVVTTSAERLAGVSLLRSAIHDMSHPIAERCTTAADSPWLVFDTTPWNKLFRREFFDETVGRWPAHQIYEDIVPMTSCLLRARRVGVLTTRHYLWRLRGDGTSITQQRAGVASDLIQIGQTRQAWRVVNAHGTGDVADWFAWKTYQYDFIWMIRKLAILGGSDRRTLTHALAGAMTEIGSDVVGTLPADLRRCVAAVTDTDPARARRLTAVHRPTLLPDRRTFDVARREPALDARWIGARSHGEHTRIVVSTPTRLGEPTLELSASPPWVDPSTGADVTTLRPIETRRIGPRIRCTFEVGAGDLRGVPGQPTFLMVRAGSSSGEPVRSVRDRLASDLMARHADAPVRVAFGDSRPVLLGRPVAPFVDHLLSDGDRLVLRGVLDHDSPADRARIADELGSSERSLPLDVDGRRFELEIPLPSLESGVEYFLAFTNSNCSALPTPVSVAPGTLGVGGPRASTRVRSGPNGQVVLRCNSNDLRSIWSRLRRRIRAIS